MGFSDRLIELLHKPILREAMGAKGRAFVRLHYSSAAAASRLSLVIETAVSGGVLKRRQADGRDAGVSA
jgi:hypothetical protein